MSLIPEDRAAAVLHYHQHSPYSLEYLIADAIHAAILEERERAAKIADDVGATYSVHNAVDSEMADFLTGASTAARNIAHAIRAPD